MAGRLRRGDPRTRCECDRSPGRPALLLAVGLARLGVPALSLAMLLATREASGGYATAGAVGAAYALAVAALPARLGPAGGSPVVPRA